MTGMLFSGVMVMASTGQYIRHKWQIWQSSGYLMTALPVPRSMRMTSVGQDFTQFSQPMHPLIDSIAMFLVFYTLDNRFLKILLRAIIF